HGGSRAASGHPTGAGGRQRKEAAASLIDFFIIHYSFILIMGNTEPLNAVFLPVFIGILKVLFKITYLFATNFDFMQGF
ncbi:hypothetical protein PL75_11475, partial [Neisseria arctica]